MKSLDNGLVVPPGSLRAPGPGETKGLLDPRLDTPSLGAHPTNEELAPLPSYKPQPSSRSPIATTFPSASAQPQISAPQIPRHRPIRCRFQSSLPIPRTSPQGRELHARPARRYMLTRPTLGKLSSQPAPNGASSGTLPLPAPLIGTVNLPPTEENIASTGPAEAENPSLPQPDLSAQNSTPSPNPRIASQPMNADAARAQARFAAETDSQLTQGSASLIHPVPNAPGPAPPNAPPNAPGDQMPTVKPALPAQGVYNVAQYTPSAQDAVSGAFSAPRQQQPAATPTTSPANSAVRLPARNAGALRSSAQTQASPQAQQPGEPAANTNPRQRSHLGRRAGILDARQPGHPARATSAASRGPAGKPLRNHHRHRPFRPGTRAAQSAAAARPLGPRPASGPSVEPARAGRGAVASHREWLQRLARRHLTASTARTGAPGYDQLAAIESPFEASAPLGYHARITAIAKPVFLDSGQASGTANLSVTESESGRTCLVTLPEPIGTYAASQNFTPCTAPAIGAFLPPAQQNAFGLGGELQLTFPHLTIAGGYTPAEFLVSTFTARFQWNPGNGPFTFSFVRDSEKDSQLSYAGLRDPAGNTLSTLGQIWGGVVDNQGLVQFAHGDAESGFYFAAGGQYLTGVNVETNNRVDGTGGAYWRVYASPEFGNLTIGANFFAMHYANNQNAFTHGMGGYFSPQAYFLGNVPVNWAGHYGTRWHYNIVGALGVQAFQEDSTPSVAARRRQAA